MLNPFYRTLQSHQGIDYTIPEGQSIFATADGRVKDVLGKSSTSGVTIVIDHGNGYVTYYAHNSSLTTSVGKHVYKGQQIAKVGSTGNSTGNHCHFEIRINNVQVNPAPYVGYG